MRLCSLRAFRELIFDPRSRPSMATLRTRADKGDIPGACWQGKRRYIDLDAYDRATGLSRSVLERRRELEKSPDLEGLL